MTPLDVALAELRALSEPMPIQPRLPTEAEVHAVERQLGLVFPDDYRRFLLEASDVTVGTLEPATICEPGSHTDLPDVVASARAMGVPKDWLPICEDNAGFFCLDAGSTVRLWSHNGLTHESWPNLAAWIREVWIGERA